MGNKESKVSKDTASKACESDIAASAQKEMESYKSAKDAFIEGNRLFRTSKFDLAKVEYKKA